MQCNTTAKSIDGDKTCQHQFSESGLLRKGSVIHRESVIGNACIRYSRSMVCNVGICEVEV